MKRGCMQLAGMAAVQLLKAVLRSTHPADQQTSRQNSFVDGRCPLPAFGHRVPVSRHAGRQTFAGSQLRCSKSLLTPQGESGSIDR
jgi:hypothetical protein